MKYFLLIINLSFLFSSYYAIGDTVIVSHQNESFDVCYGDYPFEELELSHFHGKISIFDYLGDICDDTANCYSSDVFFLIEYTSYIFACAIWI